MVNLHRWLKKTSPHLVIAGSLAITGLSGCRIAQYTSVEVEPAAAPSTYPTPLMVPEAVPYPESDSVETKPDAGDDLRLEPPAPPLADFGSNSGSGAPPKLPLPEIDVPEYVESKELAESQPEPKVVAKDTASTVADNDPLDEVNLFPNDNPKPVGDSAGTVEDSAVVAKDAGSTSVKSATDPFVETFEPTVANPEVPIPNPGKNTVNVEEPESDLTPVEPIGKKATRQPEQPAKETSSLFPPPTVEVPSKKTEADGSATRDAKADTLPVTSPKIDVDVSEPGSGNETAAALPVITPAIFAEKPKPEVDISLPSLDAKNPIEPKQTTAIKLPQPDQLASIAKPDGSLPKADSLASKPVTKPLFPKALPKSKAPQDAISVVAEVWSPADNVVLDDAGNAFVSHGKHISKVASDGTVEPWATMGSPRGHVILPDGSHLVADAGQRAIIKLNAEGEQVRKVATRSDGYFLRAPNDLVADSNGGVYFTDPGYARIRNPIGRIHYVAADGSVTVVAQRLAFPEGIALSPDGSKLLVVESQSRKVIKFEIRSPGQVGPKQVFAELSAAADDQVEGFANGLLVDEKSGRVFVAHGDRQQVEMLSSEGKSLRSFEMGATVNGIAFKPNDNGRLFATGGARSGKKDAGQLFEVRIVD
jgi:gluconolactonase